MTSDATDQKTLDQWIGKSQSSSDIIDARPARLMKSIVDHPSSFFPRDALPPLWHWLYFPDTTPLGKLALDGHPKKGTFLPPVKLPRRMWAGGNFEFIRPLRIGDEVKRVSTIETINSKRGKTGDLCFVTVCHEFVSQGHAAIREHHHIVYREQVANSLTPQQAPEEQIGDWNQLVKPSPAMLFRYSALTFNAHRIHYDRDYCREVENYPGLVFHGPLTATLLVNLAMSNLQNKQLSHFEFRAIAPLFDSDLIKIIGREKNGSASLWAQNANNELAMTATATFA